MASTLEVADFIRGVTYAKEDAAAEPKPGAIRLFRATNIGDRRVVEGDWVYVPVSRVSNQQRLLSGDVLIATSSGSISVVGKAIALKVSTVATFGAFCGVLRPAESLNPDFFGHYFSTKEYRDTVSDLARGVNINNLKREHLEGVRLPIPPFEEQQRIAAKLNTLLSRVDGCRERLERVGPLIKRFRQSVLQAATSGELTVEWRAQHARSAWRPLTFGDLALDVRYGTSKKCEYLVTGLGVLRIPNITATGSIDPSDLKSAEFDAGEVESLSLKIGDLLVIRSNGSLDLVGRTAVVDAQTAGLLYAGYLIRLRLDEAIVDPTFAYFCMASPRTRQLLTNFAKSTSGVNNVNAGELRALPISLPPLDEQKEVVRRVNRLLKFAEGLEQRLAAALQEAVRLTPATLAKAFRGELVPQDPNDEPAEVLLARICAERAAAPATPRRGRQSTAQT